MAGWSPRCRGRRLYLLLGARGRRGRRMPPACAATQTCKAHRQSCHLCVSAASPCLEGRLLPEIWVADPSTCSGSLPHYAHCRGCVLASHIATGSMAGDPSLRPFGRDINSKTLLCVPLSCVCGHDAPDSAVQWHLLLRSGRTLAHVGGKSPFISFYLAPTLCRLRQGCYPAGQCLRIRGPLAHVAAVPTQPAGPPC